MQVDSMNILRKPNCKRFLMAISELITCSVYGYPSDQSSSTLRGETTPKLLLHVDFWASHSVLITGTKGSS